MVRNLFWSIIAYILSRPAVLRWLVSRYVADENAFHIFNDDGSAYMLRWWVFNPCDERNFSQYPRIPFSIQLHRIMRPDEDRHEHDHPGAFRTIILRGTYVERRENGARYVRIAGDTAHISAYEFHRILQVQRGTWTLVIRGRRVNEEWGFMVDGVKIPSREYFRLKRQGKI